jgi:hypothetical protein
MLSPILGSTEAEKVLVFIAARGDGYAYEIARFFKTNLRGIQKQLERLEHGGVLASKKVGRTRVYSFNPRYPFLIEIRSLLQKATGFYSVDLQNALFIRRERPRRKGKPL